MGAGVTRKSLRLGEDPRWDSVSFAHLAAALSPAVSTTQQTMSLVSPKELYVATGIQQGRCFPGDEFCTARQDVPPSQAEMDALKARSDAAQEFSYPKSGSCPNGRRWTPTAPCTDRDAFNPDTAYGICPDGLRMMTGQPCRDGSRAVDVQVCPDGTSAYPGTCPAPSGGGSGSNNVNEESTGPNKMLIAAGVVGFGAILVFVLRRQRQAR